MRTRPATRTPHHSFLQPGVDRLGLQGQDGKDPFIDAQERFPSRGTFQSLDAEGVLAGVE